MPVMQPRQPVRLMMLREYLGMRSYDDKGVGELMGSLNLTDRSRSFVPGLGHLPKLSLAN